MKKLILFTIILFTPYFIMAKELIGIDWVNNKNTSELHFISETDGKYKYVSSGAAPYYIITFNKNGEVVFDVPYEENLLNNEELKKANLAINNQIIELNKEKGYYYNTLSNKLFIGNFYESSDLDEVYLNDLTEEQAHEYFGEYYFLYEELVNHPKWGIENAISTSGLDIMENYYGLHINNRNKTNKICNSMLFNKQGTKIIEKSYNCPNGDYSHYSGMHFTADKDNIFSLYQNDEKKIFFTKYDLNGKIIKEEELTKLYDYLLDSPYFIGGINVIENGFLIDIQTTKFIGGKLNNNNNVIPSYLINNNRKILPKNMAMPRPYFKTITFKLSYSYVINTKVEGKGNIKVQDSSTSGEGVTFTIEPEKGYVLDEVKVTDSNGNTVTLVNNTFTMPSSDVTIEAVFVPVNHNPNTADTLFLIMPFIVLGGAIASVMYKKVSWLR